jgi:hypothetical protein
LSPADFAIRCGDIQTRKQEVAVPQLHIDRHQFHSRRFPRSADSQKAAGFLVAGFQVQIDAQIDVQPDWKRR